MIYIYIYIYLCIYLHISYVFWSQSYLYRTGKWVELFFSARAKNLGLTMLTASQLMSHQFEARPGTVSSICQGGWSRLVVRRHVMSHNYTLLIEAMTISGTDWLELPTIYQACFSGQCFDHFWESPPKIWESSPHPSRAVRLQHHKSRR